MTLKIVLTLIGLGVALTANSAWAYCTISEGSHQFITFTLAEPLSIPLDASDGTLIATITSNGGISITFSCNSSSDPTGIKSLSGDTPVNKIIPFGNTGLGYSFASGGGPDSMYPTYRPAGTGRVTSVPYRISIYKIGPIKKTALIPAGDLANYMAGTLKIYTARLTNDFVVAAGSCELDSKDVSLGEHLVSEFSAIGYTSKPIDFNIGLRNCSGTINKVKYVMTPGRGWHDQNNGIMNLDPGSVKGLGVQIKKDGYPIRLGVDNELPPPSGSSASYSFTASYYQIEKHVGIGNANSSLTVEVSYL